MTKLSQKQIDAYEAKGFRRWTRGNMDRLYISAKGYGVKYTRYANGNVSGGEFAGEQFGAYEARNFEATKVYIDVKTGELNIQTRTSLEDEIREVVEAVMAEVEQETTEPKAIESKADGTVTATITITGKREDVDEILVSIYKKGEQMSLDVLLESIC